MKITGLNSHVSCTTYSCKTFYIKATCTTSSGFIIIIIIIIINLKNVKESAMAYSEVFYLNNMFLGRHLKLELSANHRVMLEFLIYCIPLQA